MDKIVKQERLFDRILTDNLRIRSTMFIVDPDTSALGTFITKAEYNPGDVVMWCDFDNDDRKYFLINQNGKAYTRKRKDLLAENKKDFDISSSDLDKLEKSLYSRKYFKFPYKVEDPDGHNENFTIDIHINDAVNAATAGKTWFEVYIQTEVIVKDSGLVLASAKSKTLIDEQFKGVPRNIILQLSASEADKFSDVGTVVQAAIISRIKEIETLTQMIPMSSVSETRITLETLLS
jgi:hypothetical protein